MTHSCFRLSQRPRPTPHTQGLIRMQTLVRKSHLHLAPDHDTTPDSHTLGTAYTLTRPHAPTHILSHQRTHTSTGAHNQRTNTFHHPYTHKQDHPQTPRV